MNSVNFQQIINFWFTEIKPSQWWVKDEKLDQEIKNRFSEVHQQAISCELFDWRKTPEGRLAEIIVLDQFSRNMFRGSAESFKNDSLALALAQEAISVGADQRLSQTQRGILYLPFMHSESVVIHERALALYQQCGVKPNLDAQIKHKKIIDQFGRYPHRNAVMGRPSTKQEGVFLKLPNSGF
ncbi:MAG: DUF924 domain-containing protein [Pseudomonadales bacterium]|nr:DUF924 domain-containing protein [Pseudomonadales bacterium]